MTFLARRPLFVPAAISVLMSVGAAGPRPHWYYDLLDWVVCAAAAAFAAYGSSTNRVWTGRTFGLLAAFSNPVVLVHLARKIWQPIDAVAGIAFIVGAILLPAVSGRQQSNFLSTISPGPGPATDFKLSMGV
jgi:hypothetical protein